MIKTLEIQLKQLEIEEEMHKHDFIRLKRLNGFLYFVNAFSGIIGIAVWLLGIKFLIYLHESKWFFLLVFPWIYVSLVVTIYVAKFIENFIHKVLDISEDEAGKIHDIKWKISCSRIVTQKEIFSLREKEFNLKLGDLINNISCRSLSIWEAENSLKTLQQEYVEISKNGLQHNPAHFYIHRFENIILALKEYYKKQTVNGEKT